MGRLRGGKRALKFLLNLHRYGVPVIANEDAELVAFRQTEAELTEEFGNT